MKPKKSITGFWTAISVVILFVSICVQASPPFPEEMSISVSPYRLERPMAGTGAFVIDGVVYVLTYTDSAGIYKADSSKLEKVIDGRPSGFIKRSSFNVEVMDGKAFILGGSVDHTVTGCTAKVSTGAEYDCSTDEVWMFDGNKLTKTHPMKHAREVAASGIVDHKIFVIGGWFPNEENVNLKDVEVFDGERWNEMTPTGNYYPVRSAAYATVDKKIYLFGGCLRTDEKNPATFSCNTNSTQIFDTETGRVSQGKHMPVEGRHYSGQHTLVRGKLIYVFGGSTAFSNKIFDDIAVYDTTADSWFVLKTSLNEKRKSTGSALVGDQFWIFGGITCDKIRGCPANGGSKGATDTVEHGRFK